jgi:hypothetical protein
MHSLSQALSQALSPVWGEKGMSGYVDDAALAYEDRRRRDRIAEKT